MKFQAEIGNEKHEITLRRENNKVFAEVDGRTYELDVSEPEPGVYLFKLDARIYEAAVTQAANTGGPTHVRIGPDEFDVRLIDPKRLRGQGSGSHQPDGVAEIKTAMPGKVVRVLVEPGKEVQQGDGIIVVEAMKMQNELKSPKAGVVKEIRVAEGAAVGAGDILATID